MFSAEMEEGSETPYSGRELYLVVIRVWVCAWRQEKKRLWRIGVCCGGLGSTPRRSELQLLVLGSASSAPGGPGSLQRAQSTGVQERGKEKELGQNIRGQNGRIGAWNMGA